MSATTEHDPRPEAPARVTSRGTGPGWYASDCLAIAWRTLLSYPRVPALFMAATVMPIMTVLLFYYIFGGAIGISAPHHRYIDYLIPGVLGWSVVIGAQGTAVGLAGDVKSGLIQRMWSLPMSRTSFLVGRILADSVRNLVVMVLILAVGLILGFRAHGGVGGVVLAVITMLVFGFAASWIFATIGLAVADPEGAQAATFPPLILLVFSSSAFVPPATMPHWLRPWADHQPLSAALGEVRGLILGTATTRTLVEVVVWIVVILLVFVPLARLGYRKAA